jgi:hypothetical protein
VRLIPEFDLPRHSAYDGSGEVGPHGAFNLPYKASVLPWESSITRKPHEPEAAGILMCEHQPHRPEGRPNRAETVLLP